MLFCVDVFVSVSQGRDMRLCVWDLSEGRSAVADSLLMGSVGFCQCCLLETRSGAALLGHPTEQMEEVRTASSHTVHNSTALPILMLMSIFTIQDDQ